MPEAQLRDPIVGTYAACGPTQSIKKEFRNLWDLVIQIIYTKMILIRLVLLMMQHILIVKI